MLAYLLTTSVLMLTPGPDVLFCLGSGMKGGPRAGVLAALGAATGEVVHITASALGLAAMFRAAPIGFDIVRIIGAGYVVMLGVQSIRRRGEELHGARTAAAGAGALTGAA